MADALEYAHRQGVVHRDIKPANLLLDKEGTIWITDFGLARCAGQEELTQTGDLVGTLRYAAPERLHGQGDTRADVYSLGLTLYELLTLRHPFDAGDRVKLVRQIEEDEPKAPRSLDSRIPRDLETIVLKAMAHNPARRYATAGEMAADLRRFLDDKPIAARRIGLGERVWRWCVRRPALASLAAALLVSLAVGLGGICWQWARAEINLKELVRQQEISQWRLTAAQSEQRRAEQHLAEAGRQRTIAEREAARAEDNYQTARKAVNELLTVDSEDELANLPGLQPIRLMLLTRALEFYEEMLADGDEERGARRDLALAYLRLGILKRQMGTSSEAADAYGRTIALLEAADANSAADRESAILLVRTYNTMAVDQIDQHKTTEAQETLEKASKWIDRLLVEAPDDDAVQSASAMTLNNIGYRISESLNLDEQDRKEEAIQLHEEALVIYRRLAERQPDSLTLQYSIATTLSNLGRRHASLRRYTDAQRLIEECRDIRLDLARRRPASLMLQHGVAAAHNALGDIVMWSRTKNSEQLSQAVADYERALEIQQRLARENPAVLSYWLDLIGTLENLSRLHRNFGDSQRALEWRRRENEALKAALDHHPIHVATRARWAKQLDEQAKMEFDLRLYAESLSSRLQARDAWRLVEQDSIQLAAHGDAILENFALMMVELGMHDRPREVLAAARERHALVDGPSELLSFAYDLQRAARAASRGAHLDNEALADVSRCQELAVTLFRQAAAIDPTQATRYARGRQSILSYASLVKLDADVARNPDNAAALASRSRLLRQLGATRSAQADWENAVRRLDASLNDTPDSQIAYRQRALLHFDAEQWEQAIADATYSLNVKPDDLPLLVCRARASAQVQEWQQAYEDFSQIVKLRPSLIYYWPERCRAACQLGRVDEALADANGLVGLAEQHPKEADFVVWSFLAQADIARYPEVCLVLAEQAFERNDTSVYQAELGCVLFYLGRYREAVENLRPSALKTADESSSTASFFLAMSHHHLGEREESQQAFRRAVRKWKLTGMVSSEQEILLRSLWQQAKTLLGTSEISATQTGE